MGTGASKDPSVGVQLNPRVQYAGNLARQEGKVRMLFWSCTTTRDSLHVDLNLDLVPT